MIIAIGHRSGHGKDTLADFLVHHLKMKYQRKTIIKVSFAWKIKQIAYDLYNNFGHCKPEFYDTAEGRLLRNIVLPNINLTPVEIWIKIGTPCFRDKIYTDTWSNYLHQFAKDKIVIAPDLRFPNEIEVSAFTIKCTNPRIRNRTGLSVDDVLEHWDGWNCYVTNDGTLEDLNNKALKLIEEHDL